MTNSSIDFGFAFIVTLAATSCSSSGDAAGPSDALVDTAAAADTGAAPDTGGTDGTPGDTGGSGCPGRPKSSCTDSVGCAWVVAAPVDLSRGCRDSAGLTEMCMKFRMAPAIVSCRIKISTGDMFSFPDAMAPPDADYTDWRECTAAEREAFSKAQTPCASTDGGVDGG